MHIEACSEDWSAMRFVEGGRFCDRCQHAVVDFVGWRREAVLAYKRQHPEACGRYEAEHIEPHLVPLVDLLLPKRRVLAAGLLLGSVHVMAQADAPAPTEQLPFTSGQANVPEPAAVSEKPDGVHGICPVPVNEPVKTQPYRRRPHRKVYVSRRFPFIHIRRRRVMGRLPAFL